MLKWEVCLENAEHFETGTKINLPVAADVKNLHITTDQSPKAFIGYKS